MTGRPASGSFPVAFANDRRRRGPTAALCPRPSLITKFRPGWYGTFNQLVNGIGGPQYVYLLLTGYEAPSQNSRRKHRKASITIRISPMAIGLPWRHRWSMGR